MKATKSEKFVAIIILILCALYLYYKFAPEKKYTDEASLGLQDSILIITENQHRKDDSLHTKMIDSIYEAQQIAFSKTKAGKIYKNHPEWSKEDCEKLANRRVWVGMEYDMLLYLRGKPNKVNTSNYGAGNEYQCCWDNYDISYFYMGEDHIITSYN
jgi:hypothetical protein